MGLGRRTDFDILKSRSWVTGLVLSLFLAFFAFHSYAQNYDIKKISRDEVLNRDPVISETGLAAWMFFNTNNINSSQSHIAAFANGELREVTADLATLYGASKPHVQSNLLMFTANTRAIEGNITWTLAEVATRDEGENKELDARYSASEDGRGQLVSDIVSSPDSTNEPAATPVGVNTNGPRRLPSGDAEVWSWRLGDADIQRVTHDTRNDFAPSHWGNIISWQKAKGWPFGWEIMALVDDTRMQLTTNFYYDMGPKVQGDSIVWYGWDGFDYEIYMFDAATTSTVQITSNRYDDVAPTVWDGVVVWEGYSAVEADIFMWRNGEITKVSYDAENPQAFLDDDLYPRIWNNKVVWQGFDGDDFEIYLYDIVKGNKPIKLTTNKYDDTNLEIHDDLIVWMGYHENWDSEIFYIDVKNLADGAEVRPVQLTTNEEDDREPKTASRRIIWVAETEGVTSIMLAEPK